MRRMPAPSRPVERMTVAGVPPRSSAQRLMNSWSVVVLALSLVRPLRCALGAVARRADLAAVVVRVAVRRALGRSARRRAVVVVWRVPRAVEVPRRVIVLDRLCIITVRMLI